MGGVGEVVPFSNKTQEIKSLNKHTTQHAKQNKESGGVIEGKRKRKKGQKKTPSRRRALDILNSLGEK